MEHQNADKFSSVTTLLPEPENTAAIRRRNALRKRLDLEGYASPEYMYGQHFENRYVLAVFAHGFKRKIGLSLSLYIENTGLTT